MTAAAPACIAAKASAGVGTAPQSVTASPSPRAASITTALNKYYGLTAVRTNSTIALSLTPGAAGNGKVLSNDVITPGKADIVPMSDMTDGRWHLDYQGWAAPWGQGVAPVQVRWWPGR